MHCVLKLQQNAFSLEIKKKSSIVSFFHKEHCRKYSKIYTGFEIHRSCDLRQNEFHILETYNFESLCSLWKVIHNTGIDCSERSSTYRSSLRCTLLILTNKKKFGKQGRKHPPSTLLSSESTWQGGREKEKHSLSSMQTGPCLCMSSSCKAPNTSCKCSITIIQKGKTKPQGSRFPPIGGIYRMSNKISVIWSCLERKVFKKPFITFVQKTLSLSHVADIFLGNDS